MSPQGRETARRVLALDVVPKAHTIFSPLVTWVTEAWKRKAVGNISALQAHAVNNIPYKSSIKRQNYYIQTSAKNNYSAL